MTYRKPNTSTISCNGSVIRSALTNRTDQDIWKSHKLEQWSSRQQVPPLLRFVTRQIKHQTLKGSTPQCLSRPTRVKRSSAGSYRCLECTTRDHYRSKHGLYTSPSSPISHRLRSLLIPAFLYWLRTHPFSFKMQVILDLLRFALFLTGMFSRWVACGQSCLREAPTTCSWDWTETVSDDCILMIAGKGTELLIVFTASI